MLTNFAVDFFQLKYNNARIGERIRVFIINFSIFQEISLGSRKLNFY